MSLPDPNNLTLLERTHLCKASLHQRDEICQAIRFGTENHDGNPAIGEILLVLKPLVHGQENLKSLTLCNRKEFAVLLSAEQCLGYRLAVVTRKPVFESSGKALVQEDFHPSWLTRSSFPCSRAEIAASRVTVGKSSRNSTSVCPPSRSVSYTH